MTKNNLESMKLNRTLDIALVSLAKFPWLHLFPVAFDSKAQPLLKDYLKRASNDPAQIRRWHAYWKTQFKGQECWWGVAPALSGLVFADIDTKLGKPGQQTFELFDMLYCRPETLVTGSPSGGRHHWYRGRHLFAIGTDKCNHPGIDFSQYVILPVHESNRFRALCRWRDYAGQHPRSLRCGEQLVLAAPPRKDRSAGPRRHAGQGANRSRRIMKVCSSTMMRGRSKTS